MPLAVPEPQPQSTLERTSDGWRDRQVYLVRNTTPKAAIDDVGIAHGTAHGEIPGIYALDFAARAYNEEPGFFLVTVTYRRPELGTVDNPPEPTPTGGLVQTGARVQPATFTRDVGGVQITTEHTFSDPDRAGLVTQPAEVDGFIATPVYTATRTESESPFALSKLFVGRVNASTFLGEPAETWLCTAIEGVSEDGGVTWTVTYEFEYRSDTWRAEVVFIDEKTNRPVSGLTVGVELKTYQVYPLANFGTLNL